MVVHWSATDDIIRHRVYASVFLAKASHYSRPFVPTSSSSLSTPTILASSVYSFAVFVLRCYRNDLQASHAAHVPSFFSHHPRTSSHPDPLPPSKQHVANMLLSNLRPPSRPRARRASRSPGPKLTRTTRMSLTSVPTKTKTSRVPRRPAASKELQSPRRRSPRARAPLNLRARAAQNRAARARQSRRAGSRS